MIIVDKLESQKYLKDCADYLSMSIINNRLTL